MQYRERLGLSYNQLLDEPVDEVRRAQTIWSLQEERANLKEDKT